MSIIFKMYLHLARSSEKQEQASQQLFFRTHDFYYGKPQQQSRSQEYIKDYYTKDYNTIYLLYMFKKIFLFKLKII